MTNHRFWLPRCLVCVKASLICLSAFLLAVAFSVCTIPADGCAEETRTAPPDSSLGNEEAPDVLIVPEEEPWLLAVAAPVAGRLRDRGGIPLLVAVGFQPGKAAETLLGRLAPSRRLVLACGKTYESFPDQIRACAEVISIPSSPSSASLMVAERFWGESEKIVVATLDDVEAVILGSTLAAHLSLPLVLFQPTEDSRPFSSAFSRLGVKEIFVATSDPGGVRRWTEELGPRITLLRPEAIQRRLIAKLRPKKVRNIVITRVPSATGAVGATAWLAPYVSLARGSAVVISDSEKAEDAEAAVEKSVAEHRLRPSTVTILGDYGSIGRQSVRIPARSDAGNMDENKNAGPFEDSYENPYREKYGPDDEMYGGSYDRPNDAKYYDEGYDGPYEESDEYDVQTDYVVQVEPCMPAGYQEVATVGVGRIPFATLEDASIMFACGLARERLLLSEPARVLMVANPADNGLALPLCETLSRITACEYKNARIHIEEFYGTPTDKPEIVAATSRANLILYEGHLYHQHLFKSRIEQSEGDWDYDEDGNEYYERTPDTQECDPWPCGSGVAQFPTCPIDVGLVVRAEVSAIQARLASEGRRAEDLSHSSSSLASRASMKGRSCCGTFVGGHGLPSERLEQLPSVSSYMNGGPVQRFVWSPQLLRSSIPVATAFVERRDGTPDKQSAVPASASDREPLKGLPVVILQTCDSLDGDMMRRIHELGGVALVGSTSHIHSASGASLIKAVSDGLLYRGESLGEAMRDAQNYFFCLQDLKNGRGHSQQAKSQRVALSFQLWGDPELKVFAREVKRPKAKPVSIEWRGADELAVAVPSRRLETAETEKYFVRMFPASQTAGLVKRLKHRPVRRVTPTYFFRLPLPQDFAGRGFGALARPDDEPNRAVFRVDPLGRFLYVLYYPKEEKPNETFSLQFVDQG